MDPKLLATIIIFPIWLTLVLVFRKQRQWFLYYLIASFGLTIQLVFLAQILGIDKILVNVVSFQVSIISKYFFDIPMNLLTSGRFQMIANGNSLVLGVGIECSAILETSIIVSLVVFYPLFNIQQKILRAVFGLVVTYVINIIRLLIIVLMAYKFGPDYIYLAHAGVARIFFFAFELLLYWYLMTKPTVKSVGDSIRDKVSLAQAASVGYSFKTWNAIAQVLIIGIVLLGTFYSFRISDEWHKAFNYKTTVEQPLMNQNNGIGDSLNENDKPARTQTESVLGASSAYRSIKIEGVMPKEIISQEYEAEEYDEVNIKLSQAESPLMLEVFINGEFQNRSYVDPAKAQSVFDMKLFENGFEIYPNDKIELRIQNVGDKQGSYSINITGQE